MEKTKNDKAWELLFDKYNIKQELEEKGYFIITSMQINEFRQARLMTKFDNQKMLPQLFKENKLSILPISGNSYILGNFKLYKDIPKIKTPIQYKEFPKDVVSIDYNKINSEAIALNCAYISNIINDFTGEESTVLPTVSGKMSSGEFCFKVDSCLDDNNYTITVDRSGIEIDAAYETSSSLILIEAKNVIAKDFLVRQLYYPYRLWKSKLNKKVRNVFMQYNNGIFNLYEYEFRDIENYNSLQLINSKRYSIIKPEEMRITLNEILAIAKNIEFVKEPEIPFPQANSFERIISMLEMLNVDVIKSKEEITEEFKFNPRQTDYYFNAGKYLGFIEEDKVTDLDNGNIIEKQTLKLSNKGKQLFKGTYKDRQLSYVKAILEHQIFSKVFEDSNKLNRIIDKEKIVEYMKESNLYNINSEVTLGRRASTITGWIKWVFNLIK